MSDISPARVRLACAAAAMVFASCGEAPAAGVLATGDSAPETNVAPDTGPGTVTPDPSAWGPYGVGTRSYAWVDAKRQNRMVTTQIWHPAAPCGKGISYLQLFPGKACGDVEPEMKGAPYPIILFSHGFKGVNTQSVSLIEHLASHGYVVVAPNHVGNTLFDFTAKDKDVANAAIERANDVRFAYDEALKLNAKGDLAGSMDSANVAMTGHSFGAWTALVVAGGEVDVDAAKAACAAGSKSDIFCKYLGFWPPGSTIKLSEKIPGLKAAIAWAPAGYSSFGDKGLALVKVPVFVMGGTLDNTAPLQWEIDPIYNALPAPKAEVVVQDASHMSFTNICGLPAAEVVIKDFCGVKGVAKPDDAFKNINTFSTAWLARWVAGDKAMAAWFDPTSKGKVGLTAVSKAQGL
ncbi:MAG: hypothetical protein EXR79_04350 [Myxococcales bacterium]|nr:hypothetical protein [Myxococcales bacterium]